MHRFEKVINAGFLGERTVVRELYLMPPTTPKGRDVEVKAGHPFVLSKDRKTVACLGKEYSGNTEAFVREFLEEMGFGLKEIKWKKESDKTKLSGEIAGQD